MTIDVTSPDAAIAIIGGADKLGVALGRRFTEAGRRVVLGSRVAEIAPHAAN